MLMSIGRRIALLLTTVAITLLVATSVAMAATITCIQYENCIGTVINDTLYGTAVNDYIDGFDGDDSIYGYSGDDTLKGGFGIDYTTNDKLVGGDGSDTMYGGRGYSSLYGESGNDKYHGGQNNNWMYDSSKYSNDIYFGFTSGSRYDKVIDGGGTYDKLDLSTLDSTQDLITWVDTQGDGKRDALRVQQRGTSKYVLVYNYFNNLGGTGRGTGAIESIKYKNVIDWRFPVPQG